MAQKTITFGDGRTVTFHSKAAYDLAKAGQKLLKRKPKSNSHCGCLNVCRSPKTGRFVKRKRK